jgi:hypothetical protein
MSGSSAVLVDQAIQYRFSMDSLYIGIDYRDAGNFALRAGNSLGDALVRPGRVVAAPRGAVLYRPRSGQGREEMSLDPMPNPAPKG